MLGAILRAGALALALIPGLVRADCVRPSDVVDVSTPGFLKTETANLIYISATKIFPVTVISQTNSRLRFIIPPLANPPGDSFKIMHSIFAAPNKLVASGVLCDAPAVVPTPAPEPTPEPAVPSLKPRPTPATPTATTPTTPPSSDFTVLGLKPQNAFRATRNDVVAPSGAPEVVLIGKQREVSKAEALLSEQGVQLLRNTSLGAIGLSVAAVDLRGRLSLDQLRALMAQRRIEVASDRHSVYDSAAGPAYANALVGLPENATCAISRNIRVGIIDGPVDTQNPALANVPILVTSVLGPKDRIGSSNHGTGIAALIAGQTTGQTPPGLATGAQLFSVTAFSRNGGRDVAKLENIAKALDWLIQRNVNVVNLSFAGPQNDALEDVIAAAEARSLILVAATGNNRHRGVSYPASDPRVLAVTAVDARKRLYAKANTGPEVDFAAPGVDILTPRGSGATLQSGTSFAAAIATGIVARELADRRMTRAQLVAELRKHAEDLGQAGRDEQFGWGLIKANGC